MPLETMERIAVAELAHSLGTLDTLAVSSLASSPTIF
jgi:hypothetical protein